MKRVFAFIGFTVAVTLVILNMIPYSFGGLVLSIAVVLFIASLLIKFTRDGRVICVVLGSIVFACTMFMLVSDSSVIPARTLEQKSADAVFRIIDIPEYNEESNTYTYIVETEKIDMPGSPQNIKVYLKSDEEIDADYYDTVSSNLYFYSAGENSFKSYGLYGDGIYVCARLNEIGEIVSNSHKPVNYYFIELREYIQSILLNSLSGDSAGLSLALLTGSKSCLSLEVQNNFRICGLSHYLAVSGFHISLISFGAYYLMKLLKVPKAVNTFLSMAVMLVYVGAADFSKSSVRACIMLSVVFVAKLVNNKADTLNSLGLAVLILCFNPFAVTDAGAVLTVCAVLGITVIYKNVIKSIKVKNIVLLYITKGVILSSSVLLAVTPVLYLFFGSVSVLSVILNLLAEPLITLLIISVIVFCFIYGVPFITEFQISVIQLLSDVLLTVIDFTAKHFAFLFLNISGEIFGISMCSVFLLAGIMLLIKGKVMIKELTAFICIVTIIASLVFCYQQNQTVNVYISINGAVMVYDKESAVIIGLDSRYDRYYAENLADERDAVYIDSALHKSMDLTENGNTYKVSDKIAVSRAGEIIYIHSLDKAFKIDPSCVIIGNNRFSRTLGKDFYGAQATLITFSEYSQLVVRRGTDG